MSRRGLALGLCSAAMAAAIALSAAAPAGAATSHQEWQVGFSFNCNSTSFCGSDGLGGFWGWYAFYSDGTGDATLTGCGHGSGGGGAGHENVDIEAWHIDPVSGDFVIDESTPADAEGDTGIPAAPGHYSLHPAPGVAGSATVKLNPTA